jgi:hypothetical protein
MSLIAAGAVLVLAACTSSSGDDEPVPSTTVPRSTTTTTVATTTTTTIDVVDVFVATISDPAFAAEINVIARQETSAGTIVFDGDAVVIGEDSSFRQSTDLSALDTVAFEGRTGQIIGKGAVTALEEETRLAGDWAYVFSDDRWQLLTRSDVDETTVGEIIHRIADTTEWKDTGASTDDPSLTVLRPSSEIDYDPTNWGFNPDLVTGSASKTEVHVADDGFPVTIHLTVAFNLDGFSEMTRSVYELHLEPPGPSTAIDIPDDLTISLQDLTEYFAQQEGDGPYPFYDMAVPAGMALTNIGPGFIGLAIPGEAWNIVFTSLARPEWGALDDYLPALLEELDVTPSSVEPSDFGGFPAVVATDEIRQLFVTDFQGVALIVVWVGTTGDSSQDRALFDNVLSTLEWTSSGGAVPGSSIGSAELQTDTIPVVETVAIAGHEDCGGAAVLDTKIIGGDDKTWIEHWTLQTCGGFDTYEITFTASFGGGTDIMVDDEPIATYGHTHDT